MLLIFPPKLSARRAQQHVKGINIVFVIFNGNARDLHNRSDLQTNRLECQTTPIRLAVTVRCSAPEFIRSLWPAAAARAPSHALADAQHTEYTSMRTNWAYFMAEQRPICVAQPAAAAAVSSGRMDGGVRPCNSGIVLRWRRNWLSSLG